MQQVICRGYYIKQQAQHQASFDADCFLTCSEGCLQHVCQCFCSSTSTLQLMQSALTLLSADSFLRAAITRQSTQ